jgi:hypothetical protein
MDAPKPLPVTYLYLQTSLSGPDRAERIDTEGGWYFVEGVRYCLRCQSRRCRRQVGGMLACEPAPPRAT